MHAIIHIKVGDDMKKAITLLVVLTFVLALCACSPKYYDENNISELYDSEWIIGKSREQIKDKYGEFTREYIANTGENVGSYYVNWDNSGYDPSGIHDTFFVIFNDDDIAIDAFFSETSMGG